MSWWTPRKWPVPSHKCVQGLTGTPSLCLIIPLTPCWYVCRHFTMRRERWAQTRHLKVLPSKILDTGWPTTHNLAGTRQRGWTDPGLTSMLIRTWAERMRRSPLRVFITRLSPSRSFIWYSAFFFSSGEQVSSLFLSTFPLAVLVQTPLTPLSSIEHQDGAGVLER